MTTKATLKQLRKLPLTDTSKSNGFEGEPTLGIHITVRFSNGFKGGSGHTIKQCLEDMLTRSGQHLTDDQKLTVKSLLKNVTK